MILFIVIFHDLQCSMSWRNEKCEYVKVLEGRGGEVALRPKAELFLYCMITESPNLQRDCRVNYGFSRISIVEYNSAKDVEVAWRDIEK